MLLEQYLQGGQRRTCFDNQVNRSLLYRLIAEQTNTGHFTVTGDTKIGNHLVICVRYDGSRNEADIDISSINLSAMAAG